MVFFIAIAFLLGLPLSAAAQEVREEEEDPWADVEFAFEDEQLLAFFDVNQEISALQRQTQEQIVATVEQAGLTHERFQQIHRAAQIGGLQGGAFSAEEIEIFNAVAPRVTAIQRDMQGSMQELVMNYDLSMEQYRDILTEFRQDTQLQEYVTHLARERAIEKIREERRREAEQELQQQQQEPPQNGQ